LTKTNYHPVVRDLVELIRENNWGDIFAKAIKKANRKNVPVIEDVKTLNQYLDWINELIYWVPTENIAGKGVEYHLCAFYFITDQEPLLSLQNKIIPSDRALIATPFSKWLVKYADVMGLFLDTSESLTKQSEQTFYNSPGYNMDEYLRPRGGWKSFNQIFARHFKPGFRPVAAISDHSVIISPADFTFAGQWEIRKDSNVTVKNLNWNINELLEGSPYKERFTNGLFIHGYLGPTDYHRQHAPLGGTVLEARVIHGQVYLEVEAKAVNDNPAIHTLHLKRVYDCLDNTGYQFAQTRGLIILDTPIGLIAILPVGMCQVSSVVITAEVGITVRKGEELSYFQFGGSDMVMLFESSSNVSFIAQPGIHYKMGTMVAQAYPVI